MTFMKFPVMQAAGLVLFICLITGCTIIPNRTLTILHINDIYRIEGIDNQTLGSYSRLRTLRKQLETQDAELLVLHAGDFLFPSTLSRLYKGEQMIDVMNAFDGSEAFDDRLFVTFGNHEFDKSALSDAPLLQQRIDESSFTWISSNITWKEKDNVPLIHGDNLVSSVLKEINGIKVGIFGLTTNSKVPEYGMINNAFIEQAKAMTARLKEQGAEVVIALTHLQISEDLNILTSLGDNGPDYIFGGHEHNKQCQAVGDHFVVKADADARSATIANITLDSAGHKTATFHFEDIDDTYDNDETMLKRIDQWLTRYETEFCSKYSPGKPSCLRTEIGKTNAPLIGRELKIRKVQTNLGDFVVDQARNAYPNAQIAFLNAGSLRLNEDIPIGVVTENHLQALFQYPNSLYAIKIQGKDLQCAVSHALQDWTGNGWFLQISGFRFENAKNDDGSPLPEYCTMLANQSIPKRKAINLQIEEPDGSYRDVEDEEWITAVTSDYLLSFYPFSERKSDQDGYTMLNKHQVIDPGRTSLPNTLDIVRDAFKNNMSNGLNPNTATRIACRDAACRKPVSDTCTVSE